MFTLHLIHCIHTSMNVRMYIQFVNIFHKLKLTEYKAINNLKWFLEMLPLQFAYKKEQPQML